MQYTKSRYDVCMQGVVRHIKYDAGTRTGDVFLDEFSCVDMEPCILGFREIDPDVGTIRVWNKNGRAHRPNTLYRHDEGQWKAFVIN